MAVALQLNATPRRQYLAVTGAHPLCAFGNFGEQRAILVPQKVASTFGTNPMLRSLSGAPFDTEKWVHFSVSNDALEAPAPIWPRLKAGPFSWLK